MQEVAQLSDFDEMLYKVCVCEGGRGVCGSGGEDHVGGCPS